MASNLPHETENTLARGKAVLSTFGTFWLKIHNDREMFRKYGKGLSELMAQRLLDMAHTFRTLSRKTMPVFRPFTWRRFTFSEADLTESEAGVLKYGQGTFYGLGSGSVDAFIYGGRGPSAGRQLDVETSLAHISVLTDLPIAATTALVAGTDFWIDTDQHSLTFRTNPFENPNLPIVTTYDDLGAVVDRQITLWGYNVLFDEQDLTNRLGTLIGLSMEQSSAQFKSLLNAVLDILVDGPSTTYFRALLESMFDVRFALEDEEVVDVQQVGNRYFVATANNVYWAGAGATPLVSVTQTVSKGQALFDAVQIFSTPQDFRSLDGLTLDGRLCSFLGHEALGFPNADLPVQLTTVAGKTKISLELIGNPRIIRAFWKAVHDLALPDGVSLANVMDQRADPSDEPQLKDLPKTLNPMDLLIGELQGNLMIVMVKLDAIGPSPVSLQMGPLLSRLLPARAACLIIVTHPDYEEYIGLSDSYSASLPGALDEVEVGQALGDSLDEQLPLLDSIPEGDPGVTAVGPIAWLSGSTCPED